MSSPVLHKFHFFFLEGRGGGGKEQQKDGGQGAARFKQFPWGGEEWGREGRRMPDLRQARDCGKRKRLIWLFLICTRLEYLRYLFPSSLHVRRKKVSILSVPLASESWILYLLKLESPSAPRGEGREESRQKKKSRIYPGGRRKRHTRPTRPHSAFNPTQMETKQSLLLLLIIFRLI